MRRAREITGDVSTINYDITSDRVRALDHTIVLDEIREGVLAVGDLAYLVFHATLRDFD